MLRFPGKKEPVDTGAWHPEVKEPEALAHTGITMPEIPHEILNTYTCDLHSSGSLAQSRTSKHQVHRTLFPLSFHTITGDP